MGMDPSSHGEAPAQEARQLFDRGVAAAKAGDQAAARSLFERFTDLDSGNAAAWLWRAHLCGEAAQQIGFLRQALSIQPDHAQARKALLNALLQEGVKEAKRGAHEAARALIEEVTAGDPSVEVAWMWLASLAETPREKVRHLRRVLELNPRNERARGWLEELEPRLEPRGVERRGLERRGLERRGLERRGLERRGPEPQGPQPRPAEGLPSERRGPEPLPQPSAQTAAETAPETVILVVDDSLTIRNIVARALERHGYTVLAVPSAQEALERLAETVPDLIFLDIKLPEMDGFELCKLIRHEERTKDVPIVMLSGRDGFINKVHGRMVGAQDYITKPFQPQDLLEVVTRYCKGLKESLET